MDDNTKPSARMGRKAQRVSPRQPGRRNISWYSAPAFSAGKNEKSSGHGHSGGDIISEMQVNHLILRGKFLLVANTWGPSLNICFML